MGTQPADTQIHQCAVNNGQWTIDFRSNVCGHFRIKMK
jgi:hypothetical protein